MSKVVKFGGSSLASAEQFKNGISLQCGGDCKKCKGCH